MLQQPLRFDKSAKLLFYIRSTKKDKYYKNLMELSKLSTNSSFGTSPKSKELVVDSLVEHL